MRINQIARKYGLDNKNIIEYLESIGVHGKSHSSSLDDGTIELLLQHFGKLEKEKKPAPKTSRKFAKIRRPKGWKPIPKQARREAEPIQAEEKSTHKQIETPPPVEKETETPNMPAKLLEKQEMHSEVVSDQDFGTDIIEPTPSEQHETKVEAEPQEKAKLADQPPIQQVPPKTEPQPSVDETKAEAKTTPPPQKKKEEEKKPQKKQKTRTIPLDKAKEELLEPEIIIETADFDPSKVDESKTGDKEQKGVQERDRQSQREQDEAIRREIQKLKAKQRRQSEDDGKKPDIITRQDRRRDTSVTKGRGKRAWKREKKERREMQIAEEEKKKQLDKTVLKVHDATTVADIADGLGIPANELIQKLISFGVMASINQRIDMETIQIIAEDYGFQVEEVDLFDSEVFSETWEDDTDPARMTIRPPVVTVMGHVDHGKTKLLDAVRKTDVASSEAGGITQHIGAYFVHTTGGDIVFLDTPGHEAFTTMRARGAMVTDIVILVVAADDGVMPQTREAISHAKAAGVPIIVTVNKIDLENANLDRVKQQLSEEGLIPEEWGGNTAIIPISAKQEIGIDDLLENLLLQAELLELKADPGCRVRGTIIESRLEQGRGSVATILVQQGTLNVGDPFVTGVYSGRVRAMRNDRGEPIESAGPSQPVEIIGIESVPSAGDPFIVVNDDAQAKQISARLQLIQRERDLRRAKHVTLEDLHMQIEQGEIKELQIIVKGDVQGSVGAVCDSLHKIDSDKVRIEILHNGVGAITESDVMLASASNAIIIGFNVRPHAHVLDLAKREHVDIRTYRVIYDAINDIKKAMTGMLDKTYKENILGHGEIREVYKLSKGLSIAGSFVQDGRLQRNSPVRLLRDSIVIHEGRLSSLKRFKDDVREVPSGYECGIGLEKWNDIRVGDVVECYELEEVAPTL